MPCDALGRGPGWRPSQQDAVSPATAVAQYAQRFCQSRVTSLGASYLNSQTFNNPVLVPSPASSTPAHISSNTATLLTVGSQGQLPSLPGRPHPNASS